jgi:hypothetical protein
MVVSAACMCIDWEMRLEQHLLTCQVSFVLGGFAHGQLYLVHCIV